MRARVRGGLYEGKRGRVLQVAGASENSIRKAISEFLDLRFVIHAVTDARLVKTPAGWTRCVYPAGWPDITAVLPITGQVWAIEVKSETGELRDSQREMLPQIEATGGVVTVARDVFPVRDLINRHLAQFSPAQIDEYKAHVRRLRDEARQREFERERAKRARAQGREQTKNKRAQLNKAVDSAVSPTLFEAVGTVENN